MTMAQERTRFTAYITKYALTQGVFEREVEDCFSISPDMVVEVGARFKTAFHKGEWHRTKAGAVAKAEDMRQRKIASLEASLAKFKKLRFA